LVAVLFLQKALALTSSLTLHCMHDFVWVREHHQLIP
jgi:hypothetical protein